MREAGQRDLVNMQDPNEDTQWNDVLRSKGILPPKQEAAITEDTLVQVYPLNNTLYSTHEVLRTCAINLADG